VVESESEQKSLFELNNNKISSTSSVGEDWLVACMYAIFMALQKSILLFMVNWKILKS
jgi:hypothetical protein